jgi:REP element-mobilizing transposase RayT
VYLSEFYLPVGQAISSPASPDQTMSYWVRRLPHWIPEETPIFVTWRLAGTLPPRLRELTWMDADADLDRADSGPRWLSQPAIARIVANALCHGARTGRYRLHAWAVMPNHVHIVITPQSPFSELMRWLKWTTATRSNQLLGRRGIAFWQDESYDHWIRTTVEFEKVVAYVEWNPVAAGLVEQPEQWPWSSGKKAGDKIARPTRPRPLEM